MQASNLIFPGKLIYIVNWKLLNVDNRFACQSDEGSGGENLKYAD